MSLTLAEITEKAAQHVCELNRISKVNPEESWMTALVWQTGIHIDEEVVLWEIVSAAIQIERMNR